MTNYTFVNYKNTKSLIPKEVWLTAEHLSETEPLFMTEHLVDNDGKLYRRYRLRTCDPTRFVETLDYDIECPHCHDQLRLCGMAVDAMSATTGAFCAPAADETDFRKAIFAESVIRPLATELKKHTGGDVIWAKDSSDYAEFVPEGAAIPGFDAQNDFTRFPVATHKIDGLVKLSTEFALDADFDLRKYIFERMGKSFARAEDRAFINGNGTDEPFGLLHETEGAETGVSTNAVTYDDCIDLFFSVKPEYRSHAVWLMNDRTALVLHKLKDDAGNYLWNGNSDTILEPVHICNDMPDIAAGAKPFLFGDFRYFWIIDRSSISMRALKERFAMTDQVGYVGFELLDSCLVRKDAIKVLTVTA